ncbi:hypothetical protein [Streptomyces sp. NPDC006368]|uniref:hypothetical protein n=1 Tax=Streptomyces sp. NPDC006368 TaxID=3156760 RepID=UPI0033B00A05
MRTRGFAITAVLLLAAGCSSSPKDDLDSWYTSGGKDRINRVLDGASRVNEASMSPISSLEPACHDLAKQAAEGEAHDPIPHEGAQLAWSTALKSFRKGASECTAGASAQDQPRVSSGVVEIQTNGLPALRRALSYIKDSLGAD